MTEVVRLAEGGSEACRELPDALAGGEPDVYEVAAANWTPDATVLIASTALNAYVAKLNTPLLSDAEVIQLARSYEAGTTAGRLLMALGTDLREPPAGTSDLPPNVENRPATFDLMVAGLIEDSQIMNKKERTPAEAAAIVRDIFALAGRIALHNGMDPAYLLPEGFQQADTTDYPTISELRFISQQGMHDRNRFIEANLRLAVSVAKKRLSTLKKLPMADLVQEANIALMYAFDKFDYKKGIKFSTYATIWIDQHLDHVLADGNSAMRLPYHMSKAIKRVGVIQDNLRQAWGREPSIEEIIAADTSKRTTKRLTPALVRDVLDHRRVMYDYSLSTPLGNNSKTIEDIVSNVADPEHEESAEELFVIEQGIDATRAIDERLPQILRLRYGRGHLHSEIAQKLGLSPARISQLESKGIAYIRSQVRALHNEATA
ncbi:MAG TPA: sigma-70 family RNA polymerase sigma factor [Candidatus Saccharimonadales bacterium]|nr:sigma-70 family RNA polymerase sigma factor [Candidatus Saccharimonadales bacterium]